MKLIDTLITLCFSFTSDFFFKRGKVRKYNELNRNHRVGLHLNPPSYLFLLIPFSRKSSTHLGRRFPQIKKRKKGTTKEPNALRTNGLGWGILQQHCSKVYIWSLSSSLAPVHECWQQATIKQNPLHQHGIAELSSARHATAL